MDGIWYKDKSYTNHCDFELDIIKSNIILYPKFNRSPYNLIFFDARRGNLDGNAEQEVQFGYPYGQLPTANKSGYTFDGWRTNDNQKITEETIVNHRGRQTLKASWINPVLPTKGYYFNIGEILYAYDNKENMLQEGIAPGLGLGFLKEKNFVNQKISIGMGLGFETLFISQLQNQNEATTRLLNLSLFLPGITFKNSLISLALITDISFFEHTISTVFTLNTNWSSKLSLKINSFIIPVSIGVGYFSETKQITPYVGFRIFNGLFFEDFSSVLYNF